MIKVTFVAGLDNLSFLNFDGALIGRRNNYRGTLNAASELRQERFSIRNYLIREFEAESINFPKSDVVFNLICNPESHYLALQRLKIINKQTGFPIINHPTAVEQARRDTIGNLAAGLENLILPKTIKAYLSNSQGLLDIMQNGHITYPFLLRPIWTHGGGGLLKIDSEADIRKFKLSSNSYGLYYLSEFVDYRSIGDLYRKIRMFVIDGEIYPRHHIIGENWNVHMATRRERMLGNKKLTKEEEKFLTKFSAKLGKQVITDIKQFSEKLGLDYFGIDGALAGDGRFIIFEANAAMDAFRQGMRESFPYLDHYIENIRDAVGDLILKRAAEVSTTIQLSN